MEGVLIVDSALSTMVDRRLIPSHQVYGEPLGRRHWGAKVGLEVLSASVVPQNGRSDPPQSGGSDRDGALGNRASRADKTIRDPATLPSPLMDVVSRKPGKRRR